MSNLNPGDMALIVGFTSSDINVGKTVTAYQRVEEGERFLGRDGSIYFSESGGPSWVVYGGGFIDAHDGENWGLVAERHLMPLRGNFQPERQKAQEEPA